MVLCVTDDLPTGYTKALRLPRDGYIKGSPHPSIWLDDNDFDLSVIFKMNGYSNNQVGVTIWGNTKKTTWIYTQ